MDFCFHYPLARKKPFKAQRVFPTKAEGSRLVTSFLNGTVGLPGLCRGRGQWRKEVDNTQPSCTYPRGTEQESEVVSCEYLGWTIKTRWYRSPEAATAAPPELLLDP